MTLDDRARNYRRAFAKWPASWPVLVEEQGAPVLYATWLIGNDYSGSSPFYGQYPRGYLARIAALFPPTSETRILHAFSGSLPAGRYVRCDAVQPAEFPCDVVALPDRVPAGSFDLVIADPPYSSADATKYGTPMIHRGKVLHALAHVTAPGGYLVFLDCVWPMHRKNEWRTAGRITLVRSTNHRIRMITIFERLAS